MPIWRGTTNSNWGTASNWAVDGSGNSGVPTAATDAIFDNLSPNCTVNVAGLCRNLNFNSGTGYTNTITMTNSITVGSSVSGVPNHSVTLSSGMGIAGTGAILTRANGTTTLTSNGRTWPNTLQLNAVFLSTTSTALLTDNWTVGNLVLGPPPGNANHILTIQGAFTLSVTGNFTLNIVGNQARVAAQAAALSTIALIGTGTWSTPNATFASNTTGIIGFAVPIVINTTGTITITNNCCFGGGTSVAGTSLTYVQGTVIHSGTFRLLGNQGGNGYSVNLNGSSSPLATTTSSTGVNFQNLSFTTYSTGGSAGACAITGNLCVVGNLSINALAVTKGCALTSGGTIYANGNFTINGSMRGGSNTIVVLQGTGTWTENPITTYTIAFGVSWQVQINTTGTITVGSSIGLNDGGSLTYTAGGFIWGSGYTLHQNGSYLYGIGTSGVIIDTLNHVTTNAAGTGGSFMYIFDTVLTKFGTINLVNNTANFAWEFGGNRGWECNNLNGVLGATATNTAVRFVTGGTYIINTSLILTHYNTANSFVLQPTSNGTTIFTLAYGASQDLWRISGGNSSLLLNSSNGQTIYTRSGSIASGTTNWDTWDYPRTRHSTFISN